METSNEYRLVPTFGNSFGTGWKVMADNFIRLFLIVIVVAIISGPASMVNFKFDPDDFHGAPWHWAGDFDSFINWASIGMLATFFGIIALLFTLFVIPVFEYGADMTFVQAVRKIKPDFELLIRGFWQNYLHIVLANLLVGALVVLGCFALLIPGIIIGCRLVFVSYIVMDKKLDPIEAVELSWKLTRGHGWRIFAMGFVSIFIILFGLIFFIVGIFPAIMWVSSAFATLYQSVLIEKEKPAEPVAVAA
ncbi:MAG: hypothetical protein V1903_03070 [Bacteroidota bacterium]